MADISQSIQLVNVQNLDIFGGINKMLDDYEKVVIGERKYD